MTILNDFIRLFAGFMLQIFPYAFLCILPFSDNLRFKHCKIITFAFIFIAATVFSVCAIIIQNQEYDARTIYKHINSIFMVLFYLCVLYYCFVVKAKFASKIFVLCCISTFAFFVSLITTVMWQSKISSFFPKQFDEGVVYETSYNIFLLLATIIIFPLGYIFVNKQLKPTVNSFKGKEANYFAFFSAVLLILLSVSFAILDYAFIESTMAIALCISLCLAVIAAYFSGAMLIGKIRQADRLKLDLITTKYNNDLVSQQYKHIQENIENQRMLRHNFRQQLITLRGLCEQSNADIREYLNKYLDYIPNYEITPICQNSVFNSILNYYKTTAENNGYNFSCNVNLPVCVEISEIDIITIIGNLLENAIDAGNELPQNERIITINIDFSNKMIGIAVDNSFNGNAKIADGCYLSTKHTEPAFGLQSIKIIAKKYNGSALFKHTDKMFYSSVMLANIANK